MCNVDKQTPQLQSSSRTSQLNSDRSRWRCVIDNRRGRNVIDLDTRLFVPYLHGSWSRYFAHASHDHSAGRHIGRTGLDTEVADNSHAGRQAPGADNRHDHRTGNDCDRLADSPADVAKDPVDRAADMNHTCHPAAEEEVLSSSP